MGMEKHWQVGATMIELNVLDVQSAVWSSGMRRRSFGVKNLVSPIGTETECSFKGTFTLVTWIFLVVKKQRHCLQQSG